MPSRLKAGQFSWVGPVFGQLAARLVYGMEKMQKEQEIARKPQDFIRSMVTEDVANGKFGRRVVTRFPPEPNGFLHIGHAKSICLNFGIAEEYGGRCHLRFDDTNPETEDLKYVTAIINDVKWLGFDWQDHLYFASDYFTQMYNFAEHLIKTGKAYVDSATEDEIREARGTVMEPGRPTAYRARSIEENLDLFRRMRAGEFPDGAHVLRGKIDLTSANMLMRDPILYRIRHAKHYRTGDAWCIYPLYDYAHPIEDALECVTHSLCTLEFENNRELYDWVVDNIPFDCRPYQTEFARLAVDYMMTSKRKLLILVNQKKVSGWDDPRMPTIAGLRRRGVTPEALRNFAEMVGVTKANSRVDIAKLDYAIREDLNQRVPRVLCVVNPLKVVLTNYPEAQVEELDAPYYPHDVPLEGSRKIPFARELYIDRDDFMEDPPKGYFRLAPGREVRLRYGYIIKCDEVIKDANGEVVELRCSYDPETRGGAADGRNVKGTIHWVAAEQSVPCEVRLYDRLFTAPDPDEGDDFTVHLNPLSLVVMANARIEPSVAKDPRGSRYQFERVGYFCSDTVDSKPGHLVYNRTVTLRDSWAKVVEPEKKSEGRPERKSSESRQEKTDKMQVAASPMEIISRDDALLEFYRTASALRPQHDEAIARFITNDLARELKERSVGEVAVTPASLAALVDLIEGGVITGTVGRELLTVLVQSGGDPIELVDRKGLRQINDASEIARIAAQIVAANPDKLTAYRSGRTGLVGFFIGQVMTKTGGRANPELVKSEVEKALK